MQKNKQFNIRSRDLGREISKSERSEGYLILITRRNNNELKHTFFAHRFLDDDISITLNAFEKLLEKKIKRPTKIEETESGKKTLPPEYRK